MTRKFFTTAFILLAAIMSCFGSEHDSTAMQKKINITGYVKDGQTGEMIPGVTVFETNLKTGTSTNNNGLYSISLLPGSYELQFSFIGYQSVKMKGIAQKNLTLNVTLTPTETELGEVVVEGRKADNNVRAPAMSVVELDVKTISKVPSLLGEVDLVKVIQLLPGVQSTSEGSTGFSVRGGAADQNLILLDDATIYNASHLMGFFSVFNNDAVKDVTLYKGDIPASYGGRLSSLLEVQMKEGNPKRFGFSGSIGTVSSKLTLEGPLIKDRTTWLLAGRRTYADLFLPFAKEEDVRDNKLYFSDFNLKLTHKINNNNRLFLTGYSGKDVFRNKYSAVEFGNEAATLRWNHLFSKNMFLNSSIIYSSYNYNLGNADESPDSFKWLSEISEYDAKLDFTWFIASKHKVKYGVSVAWHRFMPGTVKGLGATGSGNEFVVPSSQALESGIYITDDFTLSEKLTMKYGLRFAAFRNVGPATVYNYNSEYNPVDSTIYKKGEIYNTYMIFEPRFAMIYVINDKSSVKGSYSHTGQFITLAQNSTAGTPLNIWFAASPNVKPQICDQFAAGYFRNFISNMYEVSAEIYYKDLRQLIDFRDHANLFLNQYLEGELRIGTGYSYGIETLVRKNEGRLTGWISYTYSRSFRTVPEINNGNRYVSPYDRPHNLNIIVNYEILPRLEASATWIYSTGMPVTFPTGKALVGNAFIPIYSDRNSYRMEAYHRLDLSVTWKSKDKPGKRFYSDLNLSVYNVYNRHNAWAINFEQDPADPYMTYAVKTYLFSIIPALTYNMRF